MAFRRIDLSKDQKRDTDFYKQGATSKFSYGYFIMGKANRGAPMNNQYTAVIKKDGNWWIGWIEEVPGVNCQEKFRKCTHRNETEIVEELSLETEKVIFFLRYGLHR